MSLIATLRKKALSLGATEFRKSSLLKKKYMVRYEGKLIHFGQKGYEDYSTHKDKKRRASYRARHRAIRLKNGKLAYKNKESPSFWGWNLLW